MNTLKASIRTCSFVLPPVANVLWSPRSTFFKPGPRTLLRAELPNVPSALGAYTDVSNHSRIFSEFDRSEDNVGSPETSARCPPVPVRALSTPLVTVKPPPLCMARMPVSDQSLSTAAITPLSNSPGICQRADVTNRCRRSAFA